MVGALRLRLVIPLGGPETLLVNLVPQVDRSVPDTAEVTVLKLRNYCDHTLKSWSLWMPFFNPPGGLMNSS
jgi:hypothetical protein